MRFWKRKRYNNTTSSDLFPCGVTSENISHLNPEEIFVFGSNLRGMHGGGAARAAVRNFGAIMGRGVGLQGQSYAIPTMQGGVETIRPYIDDFIEFARHNPEMHFLVTKIGCGIAGFKITDIAPLFTKAVTLANVSLPIEFIRAIVFNQSISNHTRKKIYGQTRTLVDIISEMNKEKHFKTPESALEAVQSFVNGLRDHGDEVTWNCSIRSLYDISRDCFKDGRLDIDKLQECLTHDFYEDDAINKAYMNYVVEKSIKLIEILNEFRRYTDPQQLIEDFQYATSGVNHCGSQGKFYYFGFGSPGSGYIHFFLRRYMAQFWNEIAPNGTLDNAKFKDFMYERHARGIEKYGINAVIHRNFEPDSPCHPEVFVAYRGGAAPVYVEERYYGRPQDDPCAERAYVKSCGEGKGPNGIQDYFEFNRIKRLIAKDEKYVIKADSQEHVYYCPKEDISLPIFDSWYGKMHFLNLVDKIKFTNTLYDYDRNR